MAKSSVTVVFDHTKKIAASMKAVSSYRVMAGVPAEKGLRTDDKEPDEDINNAALMYIHEFGAPEANIPARPVIFPAIKSIKSQIVESLALIAKAGLTGNTSAVMRGYNILGLLAQNAMRKRITDGPFAPLSPRTIAERVARGRKSVKPLIDTGQLRRSLTYVIRKLF